MMMTRIRTSTPPPMYMVSLLDRDRRNEQAACVSLNVPAYPRHPEDDRDCRTSPCQDAGKLDAVLGIDPLFYKQVR